MNCKESGRIEDPATRGMMACWRIGILDIKSENFLFLISVSKPITPTLDYSNFPAQPIDGIAVVFNFRKAEVFQY